MKLLNSIAYTFVYLCITIVNNIKDVWLQLLIALGTLILHIFIQPLLQLFFDWIKNKIKSKQKTPENDGELADKLLNIIETTETRINEKIGDINGRERGKRN